MGPAREFFTYNSRPLKQQLRLTRGRKSSYASRLTFWETHFMITGPRKKFKFNLPRPRCPRITRTGVKINSTGISGRKGEKNKKVTSFSIFFLSSFSFSPYSIVRRNPTEEPSDSTFSKKGIFRMMLLADDFRLLNSFGIIESTL